MSESGSMAGLNHPGAADIVLLEKDLNVLQAGIEEGRRTFVNTLKYVYIAARPNLGNMFGMEADLFSKLPSFAS